MKIFFVISSFGFLIISGQIFAGTDIEAPPPITEEGYTDIEIMEEVPPGRDMYPYFSVGARTWFSHMYDDGDHQGSLYMYGGELNIDITEEFGIGGTLMVGQNHLDQAQRDVERLDLDVAVKYQFFRYLTGYMDFKRIDYDYKFPGQIEKSTVHYQETLNGIGFGLASAVPVFDTGFFVYLGGGFMPFITFSNFDPFDTGVEKEVDYLYNVEGGIGYFLPTRYFDLMATMGYRLQAQRMIEHQGLTPQPPGEAEEQNPDPNPNPGVKRVTHRSNLVQDGIICGLRINW